MQRNVTVTVPANMIVMLMIERAYSINSSWRSVAVVTLDGRVERSKLAQLVDGNYVAKYFDPNKPMPLATQDVRVSGGDMTVALYAE